MLEPLRHLHAPRTPRHPRALHQQPRSNSSPFLALLRAPSEVVYLNSVKSACYVRPALRLGRRVILHVHEVEPLASTTLRRYRLDAHYAQITLVACSEAARKNLARISGVDEQRITVAESTIDMARVLDLGEMPAHGAVAGQRRRARGGRLRRRQRRQGCRSVARHGEAARLRS